MLNRLNVKEMNFNKRFKKYMYIYKEANEMSNWRKLIVL